MQIKTLILLCTLTSALRAQQAPIRGTVFLDANANGTRDAGERGIRGVVVSNQVDVVVTDSAGAYTLRASPTGIIFVSVPDGYRAVGTFWHSAAAPAIDFPLSTVPRVTSFTFVAGSDPHIAPANVERTRKFRTMVDSIRPAFALLAGDLIRDAMSQTEQLSRSYFDLFMTETRTFATPLWMVPGNHDHFGIIPGRLRVDSATGTFRVDSTLPRRDQTKHPLYNRGMYRSYLGPDYYSFTYGGVHFIGLNTQSADDSAYYGDVDSLQLAWLERDLEQVPDSMPVVTFNHIPLVTGWMTLSGYLDIPFVTPLMRKNGVLQFRHSVGNNVAVLDVLRKRRHVLAIGAHNHAAEKLTFQTLGLVTRFEQTAAIVGPGQLGTMGIQSGFTVYRVRNGVIDEGTFVRLGPLSGQ
jgi:3',5'-cyclic AMP phosphodiesterase CpdA